MVSPTSQQTRVYEWMKRNLQPNTRVVLNDVTSMYTVLNVVGPKANQLLSELSNSDLKMSPFSYMKVNVGYASDVMVMSFTHTGEPGYCLYIPSEYALHIYYKLMTVSWYCFSIFQVIISIKLGWKRLWNSRCRSVDSAIHEIRTFHPILG